MQLIKITVWINHQTVIWVNDGFSVPVTSATYQKKNSPYYFETQIFSNYYYYIFRFDTMIIGNSQADYEKSSIFYISFFFIFFEKMQIFLFMAINSLIYELSKIFFTKVQLNAYIFFGNSRFSIHLSQISPEHDKLCVADVTYFLEKNQISLATTLPNFQTAT